jgi:tetratricopeptide (TPR) repeat protein
VVLCCNALPISGASAQSDPDGEARRLFLEGDAFYAEGRYEEAIERFERSYALSGRPALLFNLANSYERLGQYASAAEALRRYLERADNADRATLEARLANLEARAGIRDGDEDEGGGEEEEAPIEPEGSGLSTVGWVMLGIGGALVAGGAVSAALTLDPRARIDELCVNGVCPDEASGALSEDETFSLLADIGLFGGAAVAVTGLVLALVGASDSTSVALDDRGFFVSARTSFP